MDDRTRSSAGAGPSFGASYIYDAELLIHRLGPDFAQTLPQVKRLLRSLR